MFNHHRETSKLYDLMKLLDRLVTGPRSRLRVLVTSLYPPERCDPRWTSSVDNDESCLKSWVAETWKALGRRDHETLQARTSYTVDTNLSPLVFSFGDFPPVGKELSQTVNAVLFEELASSSSRDQTGGK